MNRGDTKFANPFFRSDKHRQAQVDKIAIQRANALKNPQSEISGAAADIEHGIIGMQMHRGGLCHQVKD